MKKFRLPQSKNFLYRVSNGKVIFYDIYEYKNKYIIKWYMYSYYLNDWKEVAKYKFDKSIIGEKLEPNKLVKELLHCIKILLKGL